MEDHHHSIFFEANFRHLAIFFIKKVCQEAPFAEKSPKMDIFIF